MVDQEPRDDADHEDQRVIVEPKVLKEGLGHLEGQAVEGAVENPDFRAVQDYRERLGLKAHPATLVVRAEGVHVVLMARMGNLVMRDSVEFPAWLGSQDHRVYQDQMASMG